MHGQRNLDVLHIILREWEHTVFHRLPHRTAEVHDLKDLIYLCAALSNDLARAGDISPGVELAAAAHGDAAAASHSDMAVTTDGAGAAPVCACILMLR